MAGRSPLASLVLVLVLAGAGWFLYQTLQDDSAPSGPDLGPVDGPRSGDVTPPPPAQEPLRSEPPPPPEPGEERPPDPENPISPDAIVVREMEWKEVPAETIIHDVVGRTGHRLHIPVELHERLGGEMVSLTVEKQKGSQVLESVLEPLGLRYEVVGKILHVKTKD